MMGSRMRKFTTRYAQDNPMNASLYPDMHMKREKIQLGRRNGSRYLR
jgi:hypothetical protein